MIINLRNRVTTLEQKHDPGFYVVFGKNENKQEKEIQDYCRKHNIDRNKSCVIWKSPQDQALC